MSTQPASKYQGGRAITVRETNDLKAGEVVWLTFRENGQRGCKSVEAVEIPRGSVPGRFEFDTVEFLYNHLSNLDKDVICKDDDGEYRIYRAVSK